MEPGRSGEIHEQLPQGAATEIFQELMWSSTLEEAHRYASALTAHHPRVAIRFAPARPFWRARRAERGSAFPDLSCVLAPPPDRTRVGRLNDEGSPRLYLARALDTAIAELGPRVGEVFHAVGLLCPLGTDLRTIVVGEHHHVLRTGYLRNAGYDPERALARELDRQGTSRKERIAYADSLMADVIADVGASAKGYVPSRALANVLRHRDPQSHGILYPSVRHPLGTNLCMEVPAAAELLKPVASLLLRVERVWMNGYLDVRVLRTLALAEDGARFVPMSDPGRNLGLFNVTPRELVRWLGEKVA